MSYHFIRNASVRSYECRGKETWFQLQVFPTNEPVYRMYRRYDDFLRLDAQLDNAYTTAIVRSQTTPSGIAHLQHHNHHHNGNGSNNGTVNSRRRVDSYTDQLCEKICTSSSSSLSHNETTITKTAATTAPTITTLPNLRSYHSTQEIYWLANKRAKRKWQQQHIDCYLSRLFTTMPLEVSQSFIVLRFLNYQPYRYYHYTKTLPPTPPTLRRCRRRWLLNNDDEGNSNTDINVMGAPLTKMKTAEPRYGSSFLRNDNPLHDNDDDKGQTIGEGGTGGSMTAVSSSIDLKSQAATLVVSPPTTVHSLNGSTIQIFLFLSPRVFITVRIHRRSMLHELRSALDRELTQRNLDPLPTPSVLAYHHVSRSDRQGALYTLTLNCSEPWLDQDTLMALTSARYLTFFSKASNFLPPPLPPLSLQQQQQHKNTLSLNRQHRIIQQGIVLLIATDKDLEAAMNGKWRRLDHVTLTCLAW
ncbi:hypothetical protein BDB00DRAFT_877203 [Zychaea mexicana]|uniref:uncharacterized protein n=1 Tax=Zychaea mexicana TaxID=64656 RepID=UPI0022FEE3E6|nr:uncharacterized protein BDB00DRAFT_877203 [Zychaea mexicana]KAI9488628.1 hypothetical protein BDB00DRAFT_877203 [Zychaea mexicana]